MPDDDDPTILPEGFPVVSAEDADDETAESADPPEDGQPLTPMVAPLAESDDLTDLLNEDGSIRDSPANEAAP